MRFTSGQHKGWSCPAFALALLLSACSAPAYADHLTAAPIESATPAPPRPFTLVPILPFAPLPTSTPASAPSDTPVATLVPTATPTPVCTEQNGTLVVQRINSPTLERTIWFRVYVPPCYETQTQRAYPVLYLLHGLRMNESAWDDLGADETADDLIAAGQISPLIIVMPRAPEEDDRYAGAVAADLVPHIDATYRTLADRQHRAIGGMSRGGGWSVRIGLQHPELFGALGLHSLAIFYADEDKVWRWIDELPEGELPRIYMDIGRSDSLLESASWLDEALSQRSIPHEFHLYPGAHDYKYWKQHLAEYLRWYAADW
jgi:enterochelin esterase-like enzyme